MVDEFVPNVSVWARTAEIAAVTFPSTVERFAYDWKPPAATGERPSPAELKVTAAIVSPLVPFSLKLTVRLLPLSKLTPL
jgi:hypothetical protein